MADLADKEITEACARAMGFQSPEQFADNFFHDYDPLTDRAQAMELGESDPVLFAKVVGVWASRGGKDNLLHMICHAFAGKQIEKEKNANEGFGREAPREQGGDGETGITRSAHSRPARFLQADRRLIP